MQYRFGIFVLIALWTLLVAPSTCGGGLLAHACSPDGGPACGHENHCPDDPCNVAHDVTTVAKTVVKDAATAVALAPSGASAVLPAPRAPHAEAPILRLLPLPADALPLLC